MSLFDIKLNPEDNRKETNINYANPSVATSPPVTASFDPFDNPTPVRPMLYDNQQYLNTMRSVNQASSNLPSLLGPNEQIRSMQTTQNVPFSQTIYDRYQQQHQKQQQNQNPLFFQQYLNPRVATMDYNTSMNNLTSATQNYKRPDNFPEVKPCHVFPPFLIRFGGAKDEFVPVTIVQYAELQRNDVSLPDIVLNFHAQSHAINFTTCVIDKEKLKYLEMFIHVVYSLQRDEPIKDLEDFTILYDIKRYAYVKEKQLPQ